MDYVVTVLVYGFNISIVGDQDLNTFNSLTASSNCQHERSEPSHFLNKFPFGSDVLFFSGSLIDVEG
jgi:hypothetical protein